VRVLVAGATVSLRELAQAVVRVAGRGRVPPTIPRRAAAVMAGAGEAVCRVTKRPPLLARGQLHHFLWDAQDSARAQRELGWQPTPLEDGIRLTLAAMGR
jgi:dihydroflavonol-4-reductase